MPTPSSDVFTTLNEMIRISATINYNLIPETAAVSSTRRKTTLAPSTTTAAPSTTPQPTTTQGT